MPSGTTAGDSIMPPTDDQCRVSLRVPSKVPFQGKTYRKIHLCPNGLICFNKKYESWTVPRNGDRSNSFRNLACLAPYFSDLIVPAYVTGGGAVFYRTVYPVNNPNAPDIAIAVGIIQQRLNTIVKPTFILIVTWFQIPHFADRERTVTFQVIYIVANGRSFTFFYCLCDGMNAIVGDVFIGHILDGKAIGLENSPDGSFLRRPDINIFSNGEFGVFQIIDPIVAQPPPEFVCLNWYLNELRFRNIYLFRSLILPRCPCFEPWTRLDRRFDRRAAFIDGNVISVPSFSNAFAFPSGRICNYDRFTRTHVFWGNNAGYFATNTPVFFPRQFLAEDFFYRDVCCRQSNLCHLFYAVRPKQPCAPFFIRFMWAFGDPHITTADNKTFSFNGHNEYNLVISTNISVPFKIQSRMERAIRADGRNATATVFTAFAIQGANFWVQAELNSNRSSLSVFAGPSKTDFDDLTESYNNDTITIYDSDLSQVMSMEKDGDTLITTFLDAGITFNLTIGTKLLEFALGLPESMRDGIEGLMGNFNGDPADDLIPRYSNSPLPAGSSEQEIFQFGESWKTNASESLFNYPEGKSRSDYDTNFVPTFLDQLDPAVVANATEVCGGSQNTECIFDFALTGDATLAQQTLATQTEARRVDEEIENAAPSINATSGLVTINDETTYLYVTVNQDTTFSVLGSDDGTFTYELLGNSSDIATLTRNTDNSADVTVRFTDTQPKDVSVTVKDNQNVYAEAIEVVTVMCTRCSDHGSCDFTVFNEDDARNSATFKVAVCNCEQFWEGDNCETDLDGCESDPCAVNRNCTDKVAATHKNEVEVQGLRNALPYTCSPCPTGFIVGADDKCIDVDECSRLDKGNCSQTCYNTPGSYFCTCGSAYRLAIDSRSCDDINECDDGTSSCDQICTNKDGGFECTCHPGYTFNAATGKCDLTAAPAACSTIDCSSATPGGCTTDESGNPNCFCSAGFNLAADNSCQDVDECNNNNICSQVCTNTVGSYNCSCLDGYSLNSDKVTCTPCAFPSFGKDCANVCECGRGNGGCNPVSGCVCLPGWTGTKCDTDINECTDANICGDINKVCTNTVGSFTCVCRDGFQLNNGTCVDVDECADSNKNKCQQECINNVGSFVCGCNNGYSVDPANSTQCKDVDECTSGIAMCTQACFNNKGSYRCECFPGYSLSVDRKRCVLVQDPCANFPSVNCSDICRVQNQAAVCSCNRGFKLGVDNQNCIDIDECDASLNLNLCSEKDRCVNTIGGYDCSCPNGFKLESDKRTCAACDAFHWGNNCANDCNCGVGSERCDAQTGCVCKAGWSGTLCDVDKNECADNPCTDSNQECTNNPGSFTCTCKAGFTVGPSGNCEDIDECTVGTSTCSQLCNNTVGGFACSCQSGFLQQGDSCTDIDECAGQNLCAQICMNTAGSYKCSCRDGFALQLPLRQQCVAETVCQNTNLCSANAICARVNNADTCFCNSGFEFDANSVTNCIDIKECTTDPSRCDQACTETDGGFACACDQSGFKLDSDQKTCTACDAGSFGANCTSTCTCVDANTLECNTVNGNCVCKPGWEGNNCQTDINECNTNSGGCPGNSTCVNTGGSFVCNCNTGFIKTAQETCQSCTGFTFGSSCSQTCNCVVSNSDSCNNVNGQCNCKTGWAGARCTVDVNECSQAGICGNDPLKRCVNSVGSFACVCLDGYEQSTDGSCQDVNECLTSQNNCTYQCTNSPGSFSCGCFVGQRGSINDCTDCTGNTHGVNCSNTCNCVANNTVDRTQTCDRVTNTCQCLDAWTGNRCQRDVDECTNSNVCNIPNGGCHNIDGGFVCACFVGYSNVSGTCVTDTTTTTAAPIPATRLGIRFYLVLSYNIPTNVDLRVSTTFAFYVSTIRSAILSIFQGIVGNDLFDIIISNLARGSTLVNGTVVYTNSENAGSLVTDGFTALAENASVPILGETAYPEQLIIDDLPVDLDNVPSKCTIFLEVYGNCQSGYECRDNTGRAMCKEIGDTDNFGLILGLSLGITTFLIVVFVAVLIFVCYRRRRTRKATLRSNDSLSDESPGRTRMLFAERIPTRITSQGRHGPIYGSELGDDYPPSVDVYRSQLKPWSSGVSDVPKEEPGYYYRENPQTYNSSWDFLQDYLGLNEEYEIRRPYVVEDPYAPYR